MNLGLNLSFAVKRFYEPGELAKMCKQDFGVNHVQFTWDLIDPWWPEKTRDKWGLEYKHKFAEEGISIDATFSGLAAYTYPQLLAPTKEQRDVGELFFRRAIDLTVRMGVGIMGTPVGGMTFWDAKNLERRKVLYLEMLECLRRLALYGREQGLKEIHIEATPLITEFPHSPQIALEMMKALSNSAIPIKLLIDWGHALYKPLLGEEADMNRWLKICKPYVGSMHLQQTDGMLDRHWDFTKEGIVTVDHIKAVMEEAGCEDVPQYLEVVPAFETPDEEVYEGIRWTMQYLRNKLGE